MRNRFSHLFGHNRPFPKYAYPVASDGAGRKEPRGVTHDPSLQDKINNFVCYPLSQTEATSHHYRCHSEERSDVGIS